MAYDINGEYIDFYNGELERLGCDARIRRPAGASHDDEVEIIDVDGRPMGLVPDEVEPETMAAFLRIVDKAFEEGVRVGRTQIA